MSNSCSYSSVGSAAGGASTTRRPPRGTSSRTIFCFVAIISLVTVVLMKSNLPTAAHVKDHSIMLMAAAHQMEDQKPTTTTTATVLHSRPQHMMLRTPSAAAAATNPAEENMSHGSTPSTSNHEQQHHLQKNTDTNLPSTLVQAASQQIVLRPQPRDQQEQPIPKATNPMLPTTKDALPQNSQDSSSSTTSTTGGTNHHDDPEEAAAAPVIPIKPRVLLGIFFNGNNDQLRNLHRTTYLNYFAKHHTSTPNRTCTLKEFEDLLFQQQQQQQQQRTKNANPEEDPLAETCRLVYTFVLEGTERWQKQRLKNVLNQESDVLILNRNKYPLPSSTAATKTTSAPASEVPPSWVRWYQFAMDRQQRWAKKQQRLGRGDLSYYFDYVAHTDCAVQLHPEEFWRDNEYMNSPPEGRSQVFAQDKEFTLLSTDLVQNVILPRSKDEANSVTTAGDQETNVIGEDWLPRILAKDRAQTVTPRPLLGVTRVENMTTSMHDRSWLTLINMWDEYKDRKLEESGGYSNPQEAEKVQSSHAYDYLRSTGNTMPPRILMGIFTMDSPKDKIRRDTIRETYLSFYKTSDTPHRICALTDITRGTISPEAAASCQLAYAFVMGSNPNGTKSLLDPSPSHPMVVDEKDIPSHLLNETDVIHLNIAENMEDGKSPTWIRFATDFVYDQFYFDYVGKMDADTLLYPDKFLDGVLNERCPPFPNNVRVFGGYPHFIPWPSVVVGPNYMSGKMYWMSPDLGRFVTSSSELKPEQRESIDVHIEDWAMANFVHSHPWPIRRVLFRTQHEAQVHPIKNPDTMQTKWQNYLKRKDMQPK